MLKSLVKRWMDSGGSDGIPLGRVCSVTRRENAFVVLVVVDGDRKLVDVLCRKFVDVLVVVVVGDVLVVVDDVVLLFLDELTCHLSPRLFQYLSEW